MSCFKSTQKKKCISVENQENKIKSQTKVLSPGTLSHYQYIFFLYTIFTSVKVFNQELFKKKKN